MKANTNISTLKKDSSNNFLRSRQSDQQDQLSILYNNSEEHILLIDRNFKILTCTPIVLKEAKQRLAVDLKEGDDLFLLVKEDQKAGIKTLCERAFEGEKIEFEYTVDEISGIQTFFHQTMKPALNEEGQTIGVIIIAKEITEKKNAYNTIVESEQRWRFALEGSNQGVWDWNIQTNEVYFSPSWRKMLEYNDHEITNMAEWELLIHPADKEKMSDHIDKHLNSGSSCYYESELRLKSGKGLYRSILARGMIVERSIEGKALRMIGTHTDITDRKNIEDKLRKSEEQYKLLFENTPLPCLIYDPEILRFLQVNSAAVAFYGYSKSEFLNLNLLDLHKPEDHAKVKASIKKDKEVNTTVVTTWHQLKKSGEQITVEVYRNKADYDDIPARLVVIKDITKNIATERQIKESNERFNFATKATSDMVWDWDVVTGKILWSDNYQKVTGWTLPENKCLTLESCISKFHPDDKVRVQENLMAVLADNGQDRWQDEFRYLKADGSYSFVKDRGFIVRDDKGCAIRVIGAMQDIAEVKEKEIQLIDANERFLLATKATSDIVYDWNLLSNEIEWNENVYTILGWKGEELKDEKWKSLIHENERDAILKSAEAFINNPKEIHWREEYHFKTADGTYKYILDRGFLLRNPEGIAIRMIGAMQDISEIKQKEKDLEKSNERFEFVSQATSDIIWDWNIKKAEIILSDNYQKLFGWELPENKAISEDEDLLRCHPDDRERIVESTRAIISTTEKDIWDEEFRYLKKDGAYTFIAEKGLVLRDENGVAERIIGTMQDISERKYQDELQSLELRVFEVSAVPNIHFHQVLKTLINGYENLHPGIQASISLLTLDEDIEIIAPALSKEHRRQLKYFIAKQKDNLVGRPGGQKNIIVSSIKTDDWKYDPEVSHGWEVSWTMPVYHHSGDLLAFITVFLDHQRTPSETEANTLARLRNLLRILMVNHISLEQIRLSNERYDNVLKATHDLVWDWNLETGSFYRNVEGLKKVYGIDQHEAIQNVYSWMERIHPEDHAGVQQVINDILHATDQNTFDVEYRFKKDDGEYSFIYDRGIIVRNNDGKPLRMIGAAQNVTDRKKLEQELLQKELDRQKAISQATIDTQEEERREIGKELHDNVNQVLTTTKLYLDLSLSSPELKDDLIKKSSKNVIYVINEIRQLSRSLMDPSIGDLGLIDSINDLVENINITRKLHVSLSAEPLLEKYVDERQKLMVFRILQEAMNNTIKYAQATSVQLSIKHKKGQIELIILDDGIGFNPQTVKKGAGLKNIQNRVYLTGGKLQIDSSAGKGCKISIHFPINKIKQKSN